MTKSGKSGGWLKRIVNKAGSVMGGQSDQGLTNHFAWLDQIEKGLGTKVVNFILSQENATVIASLEALGTQINKVRPKHMFNDPRSQGRPDFCVQSIINKNYDIGQKERFVRAIALTDFANTQFHRITSDVVDKNIQCLIHCLAQHSRNNENTSAQFSLDDLIDLICKLGGRPADLVDHITINSYSRLPNRFGTRDQVHEYAFNLDPTEVIEGINRQANKERVAAIKALTWRKIASRPVYLDFLLELFTTGATGMREAARAALLTHDPDIVTQKVIPLASAGKVTVRTAAIQILGEFGSEPALDALRARREVEKTQSVQMLLDHFAGSESTAQTTEVDGGYRATDGSIVTLPERITLSKEAGAPFGKEDLAILQEIDADLQKKVDQRFEISKAAGYKPDRPHKVIAGKNLFAFFNASNMPQEKQDEIENGRSKFVPYSFLTKDYHPWIFQALERLPIADALELSIRTTPDLSFLTSHWYRPSPFTDWMTEALRAAKFDLRDIMEAAEKLGIRFGNSNRNANATSDLTQSFTKAWMVSATQHGLSTVSHLTEAYEPETSWPLIAENMDVISDALPPNTLTAQQNIGALAMVGLLPVVPAQLVSPILFVAIGESRSARDRAKALLADVPDIDDAIATALTDKRQSVRANAAAFLAQRGTKSALPAVIKRLKTEKSETARAAMIAAVGDLDGDTGPYLSQKTLIAEAEKLTAKLSADQIDWLPLDLAPALHWKDGKKVEPVVLDAWLRLAVKIKNLDDSALFNLYLSQLKPEDAKNLADWVLTSWIGYDTLRPSKSEMIAEVTPTAQQYKSTYNHYKDTPLDEIVAMLLRYQMQNYPNSGTASKGILALTYGATPALLARVIAAYLKEHGKRVSQAKTLVEILAGAGTPEAIQVLVATSTRFKQRTVREFAEICVNRLAEDRGWTADELADRSIPSGGLEEGGLMELEVGEELKTYAVRLAPDMTVRIVNPTGKEVKSLPAGKDAATKEAKSLLSALKKTVKTVTAQQQMRLYEAMMAGRQWQPDDWQSDLNAHPIMSRLTERVVWRALAEDGTILTTFRPTPEGDLFNAEGDDADITAARRIDIAHSATLPAAERESWLSHLADFEVTPLFPQFSRPVLELTPEQRGETQIKDREGWLMEALKLRSATTKLGYDRGPVEDGAGFSQYTKSFRSAGITATLHFTGSYVPEDNIPVAITNMTFDKGHRSLKLREVPPLLLSECWNDMHDIAKSGVFDAEWQKKGLY